MAWLWPACGRRDPRGRGCPLGILVPHLGGRARQTDVYSVAPGTAERVYSAAVLTPSKCRGRPVRPVFCPISLNRPLNSASPPAWRLIMYATPSTACKVLPNRESVGRLPAAVHAQLPLCSCNVLCTTGGFWPC